MRFLYQIGIVFYVGAIRLASLFNGKAKLWVSGRKNDAQKFSRIPPYAYKTVWIHCASLGEFEQGRPVMEAIKKQFPNTRIILTFYSPSGYEIRKNYTGADFVFYLPADTQGAAARFFNAVKPDIGIIVKYEFWQGYLHEAKKRQIPLFLISGIFRKDMLFFKPYGSYFREGLQAFEHLFIQDENSKELLQRIHIENVTVCGDTRLDRVLEAIQNRQNIPLIEAFKTGKQLWVCGSTWPADDALILSLAKKQKGRLKILLVPHDIHPEYLDKIITENTTLSFAKFSSASVDVVASANILIVDTIGILMSAYAYADFVYVGGGFGKAVHNTMEPAAYGVPVLFGPNHQKFREIAGLMQIGGGKCVQNGQELETAITELLDYPSRKSEMGRAAKTYVETHSGATEIIMAHVKNFLH